MVIDSTPYPVAGSTLNYGGGRGGYAPIDTGGDGGQGRYLAQMDTASTCNTPAAYSVTGGGAYCAGAGYAINLSGSQDTVYYQLVLNGTTNVGTQVTGTGSALNFTNRTAIGTYTFCYSYHFQRLPACWRTGNAVISRKARHPPLMQVVTRQSVQAIV